MPEIKISISEISRHNKEDDCWIVVDNVVWNITAFAPSHPGGPDIIYHYAGRDASVAYDEIHAPSIISNGLPANARKGVLDEATITEEWKNQQEQRQRQDRHISPSTSKATTINPSKPPLSSIINLRDFELAAKATATPKTWAFYSSASDDVITRDLNNSLLTRILLRPRVMRRVSQITTTTRAPFPGIDFESSFPLFISPAAMARLIHPDGELAIARACKTKGIVQCISNNASYTAADIVSQPEVRDQPFIFQLYVNRNRTESEKLIAKICALPNIKGVMVTTDAAAAGKREADERVKADESVKNPMMGAGGAAKNDSKGGGYGRLMGDFIDPNLNWEDISWLRANLKDLPLFLKGVMSADDVLLALQHGCEGVVLSNHGGRNLDTSPPAILVLLEVWKRFPHVITQHHPHSPAVRSGQNKAFSVLIDGGVRRGTDILKAVCLGATAVGVGRPALFATGYGQEGVEHMIDILKDEFEVAMRNSGITRVGDVGPEYVNTGDIDRLVATGPGHSYAVGWRERGSKL
ncbi:Cytochrome b2, mitochondrial [Cyphellophora attinorum]|uniref:L-lactate dehydrogenase (cytochrome) n=1 Tax=Cyphellophora attinorum TaxID=1664694 RepID=A0A0N1HBD1_9EURO|nr:Cytochrome b2, mitochondrial [Phialophora attinorum]KPI41605.1 Cytochrome b2, mitochondrial [Phialophora attinorum]